MQSAFVVLALLGFSPSVQVNWSAPEECALDQERTERLEASLRDRCDASEVVEVDAVLSPSTNGTFELGLTVRIDGEVYERNISGGTCGALEQVGSAVAATACTLSPKASSKAPALKQETSVRVHAPPKMPPTRTVEASVGGARKNTAPAEERPSTSSKAPTRPLFHVGGVSAADWGRNREAMLGRCSGHENVPMGDRT